MEPKSQKTKIAADILWKTMLSATDELLVVVDKEGYIEVISKAYAEFLGVDPETAAGQHVRDVIENTRMDIVIKTGKAELSEFQEIKGHRMIASRIPIVRDGETVGALGRVLFRNAEDLRTLYERMRAMERELNSYKKAYGKINFARYNINDIVGDSALMTGLKEVAKKVAKTNSSVLILGESGTGKELFAHSIHQASPRKNAPFITVNCGTLPADLIESELFGYEGGSFTGAKREGKQGMFQAAEGGTIFLDEIGDLPLSMQVKLLRVLQEKEIQRIGSNVREQVNVRVLAATSRNLNEMIREEKFRPDLFYRLNVVTLSIPALRERREDIPLLAEALVQKFATREGVAVEGITRPAMDCLTSYDWAGNVREMENALERAINFLGEDRWIKVEHLPGYITKMRPETYQKSGDLKEVVAEAERRAIVDTLLQCRYSKCETAKRLGISRTTLYDKMVKYGIC